MAIRKEPLKKTQYELKEVRIRLCEGHSLYSESKLITPENAVAVLKNEMTQSDREMLCIINLDTKLRPINFHVAALGGLSSAIVDIPNIFKTGILSNAAAFLLMHSHPSGVLEPSPEDIIMTKQVVNAGNIMGIRCVDHIIVGAGNNDYHSMREYGEVNFDRSASPLAVNEKKNRRRKQAGR